MKTKSPRFKKGDVIRVMNPNHQYYDEIAEVVMYDSADDDYLVQFADGYKACFKVHDIVLDLNEKQRKELLMGQLLQLADFALEIKDKDLFLSATNRYRKLKV